MIDLVKRLIKVRDGFKSDLDRLKEGHLNTLTNGTDDTEDFTRSYERRIAELDSIISTLESAAAGPFGEG
jgi:hypothetical protein